MSAFSATCSRCGSGFRSSKLTRAIKQLKESGLCYSCLDELLGDEI